jgi:heme exporter protein D|tara:strand:- start:286 stop:429 length:144 start_codon:yes stop_codon:yes gene_type:complete
MGKYAAACKWGAFSIGFIWVFLLLCIEVMQHKVVLKNEMRFFAGCTV